MRRWNKTACLALVALVALTCCEAAHADVFKGELFYTNFTGGANVNKVSYSYNDVTHSFQLGSPTNIAFANGADGIIFDAHGNLLVGGQGNPFVHQYTTAGKLLADGFTQGSSTFHLALDPSGTKVYTSNFGGPLITLPLSPLIGSGIVTNITGDDHGLTQVAFNPKTGKVLYQDGFPNGFGNVGFIDLATGVTTRTLTTLQAAHGIVFDPFTQRITLFGAGDVATLNDNGSLFNQFSTGVPDFDQGAVDGKGHALVAGSGGITLIDYRKSGDITHPDFITFAGGFGGIDDVAPLSGVGSQTTPEPSTMALLAAGGMSLAAGAWRRRRQRA
jgi:hypothetical protein